MKYLYIFISIFLLSSRLFSASNSESIKKDKIVVLAMVYDNSENEIFLKDTIDRFNSDNPTVKVELKVFGKNTHYSALNAALLGHGQVDITYFDNSKAYRDLLYEAKENIDQLKFIRAKDYDEDSIRPYSKDGQLLSLPYGKYADTVMYVNLSLLKEFNLEVAKTYEDLLLQKEVIALSDKYILSYPLVSTWCHSLFLYSLLISRFGGAEYVDNLISKRASFTDEPSLMALKTISMFKDDNILQGLPTDTDYKKSLEIFNSGKSLYLIDGPWRDEFITLSNYKMVNFVSLPSENYPESVNGGYFYGYTVLKSSAQNKKIRKSVISLLNILLDDEAAKNRAHTFGFVPVLDNKKLDYKLDKKNEAQYIVNSSSIIPTITQFIPFKTVDIIDKGIARLIYDKITPELLAIEIEKSIPKD